VAKDQISQPIKKCCTTQSEPSAAPSNIAVAPQSGTWNRRSVDDCSFQKNVWKLNDFHFEFCLSFAFRDERLDNVVDDIGDTHMFRFASLLSDRIVCSD
jgi:hypothetical protein